MERLPDSRVFDGRAHPPASQDEVARHPARRRLGPVFHAGLLACLLASGCKGGPSDSDAAETKTAQAPASEGHADSLPADGASFLRLLSPLPGPKGTDPTRGIRLTYDVRGPAGSTGELVVELSAGGLRRESWQLNLPAMGEVEAKQVHSLRVQTHRQVWTAKGDDKGEVYANPLAQIGQAYEARDEQGRKRVVATLRDWQSALAQARKAQPGERETIEGIDCLSMTMAGQSLCVWEETGLPLRHRGDSFGLDLRKVERDLQVEASTFELPARSSEAKRVDAPADWTIDGEAWLLSLERGEAEALALVLTPGLRLPFEAELKP